MQRTLMFVCVLLSISFSAQSADASLQGVWRIVEVTTMGQNVTTNTAPQPGLYIFTAHHYSLVRVQADKPRPELPQDQTTAAAADLLAVLGSAFQANSGMYEAAGGILTTRPIVAKDPVGMRSGSINTISYKIDASTLWLTFRGGQPGHGRVPLKLKRTRVE